MQTTKEKTSIYCGSFANAVNAAKARGFNFYREENKNDFWKPFAKSHCDMDRLSTGWYFSQTEIYNSWHTYEIKK